MKTMEIELSAPANAVAAEMAKRANVAPEVVARLCLENALSQAIDRRVARDGDEWFLDGARNVDEACRQSWQEVTDPGDYRKALTQGRGNERRKVNPDLLAVEIASGRSVMWNVGAKCNRVVRPIARKFGLSVKRFLQKSTRGELPGQVTRTGGEKARDIEMPKAFGATNCPPALWLRIQRAAAFNEQTAEAFMWGAIMSTVDSCECDMIVDPRDAQRTVGDRLQLEEFQVERPKLHRAARVRCDLETSILRLQSFMRQRFGRKVMTDSGAATLFISHDGCHLTNSNSRVVAESVGSVARQLTD